MFFISFAVLGAFWMTITASTVASARRPPGLDREPRLPGADRLPAVPVRVLSRYGDNSWPSVLRLLDRRHLHRLRPFTRSRPATGSSPGHRTPERCAGSASCPSFPRRTSWPRCPSPSSPRPPRSTRGSCCIRSRRWSSGACRSTSSSSSTLDCPAKAGAAMPTWAHAPDQPADTGAGGDRCRPADVRARHHRLPRLGGIAAGRGRAPKASIFTAIAPNRLVDTRVPTGATPAGTPGDNGTIIVQITTAPASRPTPPRSSSTSRRPTRPDPAS